MRALILLHGALGSSAQFGPLCQLLEGRAKCYCPEFPGHGITPVSGEFGVAAFARKLLEFRNGIPEREVAIFGYSMGGYVALKAASGISGLDGIITLGTKFGWNEDSAEKESGMLDLAVLESTAPEFVKMQRERHSGRRLEELFADTKNLMARLGRGDDRLSDTEIAEITCEVRIARGSKDRMVSEYESREMASRIAGGSYVELPETPHPWERVDIAIVRELIAEGLGFS